MLVLCKVWPKTMTCLLGSDCPELCLFPEHRAFPPSAQPDASAWNGLWEQIMKGLEG